MLTVSMPNARTPTALVDTATKCLATALSSPCLSMSQARGDVGVAHRLERRERLGSNDEQCLGSVEILRRLGEGGAVDVGDEAEAQRAVAVGTQREISHLGAEV